MFPFSIRSCLVVSISLLVAPLVSAAADRTDVAARLDSVSGVRPRLFLNREGEAGLRQRIASDALLHSLQSDIIAEADRQLKSKPVKRVLIGRRLLDKSRTVLSRVLHLGMAWRLTGKTVYLDRARLELVAVANFSDWNPSHFLDVAEMTTAVAIGYDWFYPCLDDVTRVRLRTAIVEKGLKPGLTANSWTRVTNNWNQVCNAGMAIGAIAVADTDRLLAIDVVARAIDTVPNAMREYAPDGAYPEGPGYWAYGTTFNVLLISALESALGTDFGLAAQPGFLATADYYLHVVGPSGYTFNYSDAGRGGGGLSPAMFWFAAKRGEAYLLWHAWAALDARKPSAVTGGDRADPLSLLWCAPRQTKPAAPHALSWSGGGSNPVAFHRSGWAPDASFVAIKGGSPSLNHAHMDVGTFVMDAAGLRWADDLGMQKYNTLESKGIKLWGKTQEAERWTVFRLGTSSHNVLQIDGQPQRVAGHAPIVLEKTGLTVVNLTDVYQGQLASARRGVALQSDRSVRVQDEFTTLERSTNVRWAMVTRADVKVEGPGHATLTQGGRTLAFRVLEPADAKLAIYRTDPPPAATDARNEGTRMIGFELRVPAGKAQRLVVQLIPADAAPADAATPTTSLADW